MTEDDSTPIEATCATCGKALDAASPSLDPASRPRPGDISVCIYCGTLGMYTQGTPMGVRALTPMEHDEVISQSSDVRRILAIRARIVPLFNEEN